MTQAASPFKFLDSYNQTESEIFFGREKETVALYRALGGVKHLLVYGPSGCGKTSLVECGLRNQFSESDWFALSIRKGSNISASVFSQINAHLSTKIDLDPATQLPLDPQWDFGQSVEALFNERFQPIYLLFDQFEELLISGSDTEKKDFFTRLNQLIRYKVPCRMMLIMREEFIGHLSEFEVLCPSIFQHRFRVEKMRKSDVREVIRKTLEAPMYSTAFEVSNAEELADSILSKLPDKKHEIELAHVQVFLSELWGRAVAVQKNDALPLLHQGLVKPEDNLEVVLDSFLKTQNRDLGEIFGEKIPMQLLELLISERYTKLQVSEVDLQRGMKERPFKEGKSLADLLASMVACQILRTLKSGDETQYEISHDVLALVVGQNLTDEIRKERKAEEIYRFYGEWKGLFSQEQLDDLRPWVAEFAASEELLNRMNASEEEIVAKQNEVAVRLKEEAERERLRAEEAVRLQNEAERQRAEAVHQQEEAERARITAVTQKKKAQKMTILAIGLAFLASLATLGAGLLYDQSEADRRNAVYATELATSATAREIESATSARIQRDSALMFARNARQSDSLADCAKDSAILMANLAEDQKIIAQTRLAEKILAESKRMKMQVELWFKDAELYRRAEEFLSADSRQDSVRKYYPKLFKELFGCSGLTLQEPPASCPPNNCDCIYQAARSLANSGNYRLAINKYSAFKICDPVSTNNVDSIIVEIFLKVDSLKTAAENNQIKTNLILRRVALQNDRMKLATNIADTMIVKRQSLYFAILKETGLSRKPRVLKYLHRQLGLDSAEYALFRDILIQADLEQKKIYLELEKL